MVGFTSTSITSSGALALHVMDALKAIGAEATADIVQRALNAVGDTITVLSDDAARQGSVKSLSPQARRILEELDREYYKCPEDLTPLLYNYVAEHRTQVGAPSDF
jgi:hypothetical protein